MRYGGLGQDQVLLRARDADEAQPALFFQLVQVPARAAVRQDAFLQPDHRDDGELQPLGRVQRHQRDRPAGAFHVVGVADEADHARGSRRSVPSGFSASYSAAELINSLTFASGLRRARPASSSLRSSASRPLRADDVFHHASARRPSARRAGRRCSLARRELTATARTSVDELLASRSPRASTARRSAPTRSIASHSVIPLAIAYDLHLLHAAVADARAAGR